MNHVDLREATHDMAITALRQTPAVVRLIVLRDESQFKDEGMLELLHEGKGLSMFLIS